MYICENWYVLHVLVDCQRTWSVQSYILTLSLLMPRYLAQPFNVIKWQLKFNPAA
jgi:hypothetical protein